MIAACVLAFCRPTAVDDEGFQEFARYVLGPEISRLHRWLDDLQAGMYVNCVYCGHRYGPGDTTPTTMAEALQRHIATCPAHPMAACVILLDAAGQALQSYACGNASPDLANDVAARCDELLKRIRGSALAPAHA